ncbi:nucleotide exchange factor Sil1-like [Musca domestica]|uniref:Nucleotide exchange factor SIL1 n=1 Tax=Musca domestica TaxID=7370 RepID=A0A1I8MG65_MUSDO|nr:nucleotide exchange factor Sil1 [Musca domestica]XP_058979970.1 nucleotide exchange factor Sil1-like [Musca domestica]
MKLYTILIVLGLFTYSAWAKDTSEVKKNQTFIATHEWQEIPEGQGIPQGLHVRINLQTGKKEAKLLDEADESSSDPLKVMHKDGALSVLPDEYETVKEEDDDDDNDESNGKEAAGGKAKKVKHLDEALKRIGIDYTPEEKLENIKREFRSYEELKKTFEGMRKAFKSDGEIIIQLIEEFHNVTKDNKDVEARVKIQTQILESFNYLMSQYDNAQLFVEQGGLDHVILPTLVNQTHVGLKVEVMRVLGAMCQNNPKVQIKVYERNIGSHLTQILMSSTRTEELSTALYAFSSLLRKIPHAQQRILSTSGTQALVSVLGKEAELKIKAKAVTIISDIIVEKELVLSKSSADDDPLAAAQYAELSFPEWLEANSYCETMDALVTTNLYEFLEAPDILEYFINALDNTKTFCSPLWSQSPQFRHVLLTLRNRYSQSEDEYRLDIAKLLNNLIDKLYPESIRHDEF